MRKTIHGTAYTIDKEGNVFDPEGKRLQQYINPCGYTYVWIEGRMRTVAYLMKSAYLPDDKNITVIHNDNDRTNNRLDNLSTLFDGTIDTILIMETNPETKQIIRVWKNFKECANHYGVSKEGLYQAAKAGRACKGINLEIYTETLDGLGLFDYTDGNHLIRIYDENGNIIDKVESIQEASKVTGLSPSNVCYNLYSTERNNTSGYRFQWELSDNIIYEDNDAVERKTIKPHKPYDYNKTKDDRKTIKRQLYQYDLQGNLIEVYRSVASASEATGINPQYIYDSAGGYGLRSNTDGYVWRWEGDDFNKFPIVREKLNSKPVIQSQKTPDGTLVEVQRWSNANEAAKALGINVYTLYKRIADNKIVKGYHYQYDR